MHGELTTLFASITRMQRHGGVKSSTVPDLLELCGVTSDFGVSHAQLHLLIRILGSLQLIYHVAFYSPDKDAAAMVTIEAADAATLKAPLQLMIWLMITP